MRERFGDLVDGVIAFAQVLDGGARGGLLWLALRTPRRGEEEHGLGIAAEMMTQHAERALGVP